jgi:hypothetical protein
LSSAAPEGSKVPRKEQWKEGKDISRKEKKERKGGRKKRAKKGGAIALPAPKGPPHGVFLTASSPFRKYPVLP